MSRIVAIVGRPNVGKSTLFNRLAGRKLAIVHDEPGVTRDRHYAEGTLHDRDVTLIDTGGFDPEAEDPLGNGIVRNVRAAIEEADLVLCVLDGSMPPTPADREAVSLLRRSGKPVVYVANKADNPARELEATAELYALGIDEVHPVSALHGRGFAALEAAAARKLPAETEPGGPEAAAREDGVPRLSLLGRPNAGKSSLFNRIHGSERVIVDARPGTTVDAIDTRTEYRGRPCIIVDTAGIRRKSRVDAGIESASVMRALRSIDRTDVVLLVCDAAEGMAEQDARLLGLSIDRRRAVVVALNKMDLLSHEQRKAAIEDARTQLHFASWVPIVPVSAATGMGVRELMRMAFRGAASFHRRVSTAELNRFFQEVLERQPPATHAGRAPRLYYITQAETAPPLFVAMSNAPEHIKESYRRFVSNQIRKSFGFEAVPVAVRFRKKAGRSGSG